jgi:hypothetical protein
LPRCPACHAARLATLPGLDGVRADLVAVLAAGGWKEREQQLVQALEGLRDVQAATGLPTPDRATEPFFDRPYRSVADEVVRPLLA